MPRQPAVDRSTLPVFALLIAMAMGCGSAAPSESRGTGGRTTGGSASSGGEIGAGGRGSGGTGGFGGDTGGTASGGGTGQGRTDTAASGGSNGGSSSANGGTATGGTATGGTATGGSSAQGGGGGTASGGDTGSTVSGGTATGGSAAGGTTTGGKGGSATGGSSASGGTAGTGTGKGGAGGSASGGTAGTGTGRGGAGGSATGGTTGNDPFALAWQDDFDTLDASLWQAQSFTWEGNQAQFTPQNVSVANGKLTIALTSAPSGSAKPYLGVELRSTKTLTYGKVSASMRFAKGSGVVSGLVLFYTPYPNCDWNEIDIEHLGKSSNTSQLNCMIYTGTPATSCTTSVTPTQDPQVASLGLDAEAAFHQYDIEWTPAGVKFFVDGTLLRTWTANISRLKLPLNILLTIWASNSASWAGPLDATTSPSSAEVDFIKVYGWKG